MRSVIFTLIIFLLCYNIYSQTYLGFTTVDANLRSDSLQTSKSLKILPAKSYLFLYSNKTYNGYYNVIDIDSNKEGYIHSTYVIISDTLPDNKESFFEEIGKTTQINPTIAIYNNSKYTMTIKLNGKSYSINSQAKTTIVVSPGSCYYVASAPGVIPLSGTDKLESNYEYSWEFYITTEYK